jgi:tRNA (guanine-N(7)-)-methyltransferase subunit TRM82
LLSKNELLASGGGDDWLGIWDWRSGNLKEKRDMRSALTTLFSSQPDSVTFDSESPIAVSGIWAVHGSAENDAAILIACEKLPCLLVSSQGSSSMVAVHLPGTPLDVAVIGHVAIVSMDVVEVCLFPTLPTTQQANIPKSSSPRLQAYRVLSSGLELEEGLCAKLQAANGSAIAAPERKQLDNLLYGMENLRKRSGQDEQDDA